MKNPGVKIFTALVTLVVVVVACVGAYLAGSPTSVRNLSLDSRRVSDLQSISYAVDQYYRTEKKLPASLEDLKKSRDVYVGAIQDPETLASYEFIRGSDLRYELCATFSMPTQTDDIPRSTPRAQPYSYQGSDFWKHPAGRHCFSLFVSSDPYAIPSVK